MEVYLIRHTTPKIEKGICYGQSDVPLAASFPVEAKNVLTMLPVDIEITYSSPLTRCYELAKLVQSNNLITDERLLEYNFGQWEMKEWDSIDQKLLDRWMKNFIIMRVPGGENVIDLNKRVSEFVIELKEKNHKKVAIVTHGGVIRCFVAHVQKTPLRDAFSFSVDYSSITKIILNENSIDIRTIG